MISRPYQAIDGDVQRLCGVAGKGHMIRPGAVEQRRQLFPGGVNGPGSGEAPIMGPPGAVPHGVHGRRHRLNDPAGLMKGGGGIIKIDHGLMTFPAAESFSAMTYIFVTPPTASVSFSL